MERFKFLGVHITDKLKWSNHTDSMVKKAQQRLFHLRRLKKFGIAPKTLIDVQLRASCRALSPPGKATALPATAVLSRHITGGKLPALQDTYSTRCHRKGKKIIKDNNHLSHCLFTPLSSRRRGQYRCIKAGTETEKQLLSQGHQTVK